MKEWIVLCLLLTSFAYGCSELQSIEDNQKLTFYETKKDHPLGSVEKRQFLLTEEQLGEIAQYSVKISEDENPIVYYSMTKRRGRGDIGKGFLVKGEGEYGSFELLAHIIQGIIYDIHIIKNPEDQTGFPVINRDFIGQFIGKDYTSSFEFAKDLEDILSTPAKIKPIRNAPITSEKIAEGLRKWLVVILVAKLY